MDKKIILEIINMIGIKPNRSGYYHTNWGKKTEVGLIASINNILDQQQYKQCSTPVKTESRIKKKRNIKMENPKVYKVLCEFFVKANNRKEVETFCGEDVNFVENHIIVRETSSTEFTNDPQEELYKDLTN